MKYVQCKVFRDMPLNEAEFLGMQENLPAVLQAMHNSNDYVLTYLANDDAQFGDVWVAPYGKSTRIVVVQEETDDIREDINYRELIKKIGVIE